jgi:hypothetical protein
MDRSGTQRLFQRLLPWWAEGMEKESREWVSHCACGTTFSVWDAGGIRFKAKGEPKQKMRCPACGVAEMRTVTRRR